MFLLEPNKDWVLWAKNLRILFPTVMPNTLHSKLARLRFWSFTIPRRLKSNERDYLPTFILTAQKTGFMPAFALTLHLLSEVDGFLAAATLVSSSERHSVSRTARCVHFSTTVYITSLFYMSYSATRMAGYSNSYKRRGTTSCFLLSFYFRLVGYLKVPSW